MLRVVIAMCLLALPLAAQKPDDVGKQKQPQPEGREWEFWVRGNGQSFANFFQAPEGQPEETVTAFGAEVGASARLTGPLRVFGHVNYIHFNESTLEGSPAFRLGLRGDLRPHAFEVYAEQLSNRPSFELDEFVGADVTRLAGEYSYRFLDDWQASVDAELEQQDLGGAPGRDNQYAGVGAAIRWRGSRIFSPELGFRTGERDVDDNIQSYGQSEVYLQVRSQLTDALYLSGRIRQRKRDYANQPREDERRQFAASADYTLTPNWVLNFYGATEDNDTSVADRDSSWGFFLAGVTYKF